MIYLDNAATTYQKPSAVYTAMSKSYANPGRGGHSLSLEAGGKVYECRQQLAELFHVKNLENIIFTQNTTEALNLGIKGLLTKEDHVVISGMEHNSVLRPLKAMGVAYSVAIPDAIGRINATEVEKHICANTRLIIVTHGSNIVGTINPIREIGKLARENNIVFLVDAAQTAGVIPIDVEEDNIDLLAFAGHKMLYGPQGTGGLYIRENLKLKPLKEGGTGSLSEYMEQPDFLPDRFESGTLNTPGIAGLYEGVCFIQKIGYEKLLKKEQELTKYLLEELLNIDGVTVYGAKTTENRLGVVGFNLRDLDCIMMGNLLDEDYNIACRAGLHCSALAHQSMGTLKKGMLRFSTSYFTKKSDIAYSISSINKILKKL